MKRKILRIVLNCVCVANAVLGLVCAPAMVSMFGLGLGLGSLLAGEFAMLAGVMVNEYTYKKWAKREAEKQVKQEIKPEAYVDYDKSYNTPKQNVAYAIKTEDKYNYTQNEQIR